MAIELNRTSCTNSEWIGRAHCEKCHICMMMQSSDISESAFENILQPIDHFLYPPGSILYEAGTNKEFIYSIRNGMVKLINNTPDGTGKIMRLLGSGASIGLELLDSTNGYHHTAITVDDVDLCRIPLSTIKKINDEYPALYKQINHQLQSQLDLADQWISAFSTGTEQQRIIQLLLILCEFFSDKNGAFTLINHDDIAAIVGIQVKAVDRVISDFKSQNVICKYKTKNNLYKCNTELLKKINLHS
ncbi:MAG: Crp/Fnr family transcriptional regulator [Gammaproteobacteria bacterium]|nr:Crp/Fnr family transcriptional regulator [Gammaproteobacteria bacterium]